MYKVIVKCTTTNSKESVRLLVELEGLDYAKKVCTQLHNKHVAGKEGDESACSKKEFYVEKDNEVVFKVETPLINQKNKLPLEHPTNSYQIVSISFTLEEYQGMLDFLERVTKDYAEDVEILGGSEEGALYREKLHISKDLLKFLTNVPKEKHRLLR